MYHLIDIHPFVKWQPGVKTVIRYSYIDTAMFHPNKQELLHYVWTINNDVIDVFIEDELPNKNSHYCNKCTLQILWYTYF